MRLCAFSAAALLALLAESSSASTLPACFVKRSDCTTETVNAGNGCRDLADRCGISPSDFTKYNPDPSLCSNLSPGQRVCCSAGDLPDIRPKPNSDGTCASYVVQQNDSCSKIANANGLKISDLSTFNDKTTWGWSGCNNLGAQLKICLSSGDPPMPQPIDNAVCGPLKPGSQQTPGTKLSDMNPCPLNACCTRWGQCGITPEFCTQEDGPTGNPGTAPDGHNGCVSNCGTDIKSGFARKNQVKIGYYESWNFDRPCLNMRASDIDTSKYTHIHWAFATITSDFDVAINDSYNQFQHFLEIGNGVNRIISFGGWGYSTDPATYDMLRQAMSPGNVNKFTDNIVSFVKKHNLDGVDIDWEYPGAPDIPGIPAGPPSDTPRYLRFLQLLRSKMQGGTVSIAAPASFWYLKQFPIAQMANELDYLVFMTYDLHGQWDYGNKFAQEGCPGGNCLRSHINSTETNYALAMITKAGVDSSKIAVGISAYGRSFKMATLGCNGPDCPYEGPQSQATPGDCTGVAGYISNAEIQLIIDIGADNTLYGYDYASKSNYLIYDDYQWVSYMSDQTRKERSSYYVGLNFAGTVDWAVDLLEFGVDDNDPDDDDDGDDEFLPPTDGLAECTATMGSLNDLNAAAGSVPAECKPFYTIQALAGELDAAVKNYTDMMAHGYDDKFKVYANAVADKAGKSVLDYVNAHGKDYFSCVVGETSLCCSECKGSNGNGAGDPCRYCFNGACTRTHECLKRGLDMPSISAGNESYFDLAIRDAPHQCETKIIKSVNITEPCPPDYSQRGFGPDNPYEQSIWWTLPDQNSDKFYAGLLSDTGIAKDKIAFGDNNRGNDCPPSASRGDGNDCWNSGYDYNIPMAHGYGAGDVGNPKDVVQKGLSNSDALQQQLKDSLLQLKLGGYYGDELELVDAVSVPVLLIVNAVEDMQQVETVADEITEEKKKAIILAFIGALLFFVPIAGEVLGSVAELADVASIISVVAAAGDAAFGVYQVVDDPSNPLLGILSIVLAPLALGDLAQMSKASQIRRGMSDDEIVKLGGKVGDRMNIVQKVIGKCHKAL